MNLEYFIRRGNVGLSINFTFTRYEANAVIIAVIHAYQTWVYARCYVLLGTRTRKRAQRPAYCIILSICSHV